MPPSTNQDDHAFAKSVQYAFRMMGAAASQVNSRQAQFVTLVCEFGAAVAGGAANSTKNSFGIERMDSKSSPFALPKAELAEIRGPKDIHQGSKSLHSLSDPDNAKFVRDSQALGRRFMG